jgi:cullin 1
LTGTVLPSLRDQHNEFLLKELTRRWQNHEIMNKWMQKFFMYLDRYYVKHHSLPPLMKAGLKHFKTLIFDEVKLNVANAMLDLINEERDGSQIDRGLIKSCVQLFEAMGMGCLDAYTMDFEEKLLSSTMEYYTRKSSQWIDGDGAPAYMVKAEAALEAERSRVENYLNSASEQRLLGVVETEILEKREEALLEKEGSGLRVLLQNDKHDDLSRMYRLFGKREEWLQPIANIVKQHITQMGNECVNRRESRLEAETKEKNEDPDFVKELLALHDKYTALVENQFGSNSLFQKALKDAFMDFVNRDVGKFTNADLMSSFCDSILKTGGLKLSDEDVESYLEKTVQLFSYLIDKDLFAEIYRNQLAKRLLNQRSASDEHEKLMITKLKQRCGSQFTGKMEGMLNDLSIGVDHQAEFKEHYDSKQEGSPADAVDFTVQVNVKNKNEQTTEQNPAPEYKNLLPPEISRSHFPFLSSSSSSSSSSFSSSLAGADDGVLAFLPYFRRDSAGGYEPRAGKHAFLQHQ